MEQHDSQRLPQFQHLSPDEILSIREIRFNFPYNFAQPPSPRIHWSLADLIDHSRFPMAKLDPCDKWGIRLFSLENFLRVIEPNRIAEPGYLSPMTIAKVVDYALQIIESTTESVEALTGRMAFHGEELLRQIRGLADAALIDDELSPWRHFWIATRHPTVRWAINNAVMNRWGAEGYLPLE